MADRATGPLAIQLKEILYLRLLSLSEGLDDEISSISFDLNKLLYAKLDSKITARAIVKDFLNANLDSKWTAENLTDDEDNTPQLLPALLRSPKRKEKETSGKKEEKEEIRRLREEFAKEKKNIKQNIKISVPNFSNPRKEFSNPKKGSSTFGRTDKLFRSLNKLRIDKKDIKGIRIVKNALKAILAMTDEKETGKINKEIEATGTKKGFENGPLKDLGFGNEPFKDLRKRRTTGNYIDNLLPIRLLAKHSTLAYGTLSAFNDDSDDFLKLKAADFYLRAKDRYGLTSDDYLAAFFIMLTKEAITFYYNYVIKAKLPTFKANAIAVKDHFETDYRRQTTIARINLAFTFTAAIADIRRAIAFATETSRPPAKANRQYFGSKKVAKAIKDKKRCFVYKKLGCWSTNYTFDERKASVAKF
ncbi:hypothetical protein MBM_10028 [Drepanopeziza brunnea f. sp. 'multigermtubi' MB_m1]|uniref:Uncharacterized protein n=1 Tax=Marssonina brunnea f. sp. multigermtubi (strain MB_m1) TaxID=1072389 RepID=K1WT98_MARBU|nr:uncharacterized protein MBM_10028 [Drepanopeziza brunnea f. sp. 'multigermtubi' MB_m1]EKD11818.1 hypothetical protein MBM_10028 [Drepanopeziza brunnea f. sp. 'multigermtubi' MB_m1]